MTQDHVQGTGLSPDGAVLLVLSPLARLGGDLAEVAARLGRAIARAASEQTRRGRGEDRYVIAGTNWDGFSHKTLFRMVHQEANPAQVERLADDWGRQGALLAERAEDLQRSLIKLLPYWQGEASQQAARSVIAAVGWIGDVGATTRSMSDPLQDAAGALRSAQSTMPSPPGGGGWIATAGAGAVAGAAIAGPIGAAVGAAIGGIASVFGFGSNKAELKRRAVQTMQRYEAAGVQVDSTAPQFVDSGVGRIGQTAYDEYLAGTNRVPPPTHGAVTPVPGSGTPGTGLTPAPVSPVGAMPGPVGGGGFGGPGTPGYGGPGWNGGVRPGLGGFGPGVPGFGPGLGYLPGGGLGPGGGVRPGGLGGAGAWRNLTGRGVPGGLLGGVGSGSAAGRAGRAGAGFGGGPMGAPGAFGPGAGGTTRRGLLSPGGRLANALLDTPESAAARRAAGAGRVGAGAGAGTSPLMPGAGARGDEDTERRRRYPIEEEPFRLDEEVAPPVIGA